MHNVVIRDIADFPHCLPTISTWFYTEWRDLYGDATPTDIERRMAGWLARDRIPTALVAVVDGQVVGTVALKEKELVPFAGAPWLAGLFVLPHFRRRGIGASLLRAAENKARLFGLHKLYLYTSSAQRFYGELGWHPQWDAVLKPSPAVVMEKILMPHDPFQPVPPKRRG